MQAMTSLSTLKGQNTVYIWPRQEKAKEQQLLQITKVRRKWLYSDERSFMNDSIK